VHNFSFGQPGYSTCDKQTNFQKAQGYGIGETVSIGMLGEKYFNASKAYTWKLQCFT
jgi:hypothetical protein